VLRFDAPHNAPRGAGRSASTTSRTGLPCQPEPAIAGLALLSAFRPGIEGPRAMLARVEDIAPSLTALPAGPAGRRCTSQD